MSKVFNVLQELRCKPSIPPTQQAIDDVRNVFGVGTEVQDRYDVGLVEYLWWGHITPHKDDLTEKYQFLVVKSARMPGWLNYQNYSVPLTRNRIIVFNNRLRHSVSRVPLPTRKTREFEDLDSETFEWDYLCDNHSKEISFGGYGLMINYLPSDCQRYWVKNQKDAIKHS